MSDIETPKNFFRSERAKNFTNVVKYVRNFDKNFMSKANFNYTNFDINDVKYVDNDSTHTGYGFHTGKHNNYVIIEMVYVKSGKVCFYGNFPGRHQFEYEKAKRGLVLHNLRSTFMHPTIRHCAEYFEWCKKNGIDVDNMSAEDLTFIDMKWALNENY